MAAISGTASRIVRMLNELIALELDTQLAYSQAIEQASDQKLVRRLRRRRREHRQRAEEIALFVRSVGGTPAGVHPAARPSARPEPQDGIPGEVAPASAPDQGSGNGAGTPDDPGLHEQARLLVQTYERALGDEAIARGGLIRQVLLQGLRTGRDDLEPFAA